MKTSSRVLSFYRVSMCVDKFFLYLFAQLGVRIVGD